MKHVVRMELHSCTVYSCTIGRSVKNKILEFQQAHLGFCTLKHADFRNDHEKILRQWEVPPIWAQTLTHI